MTVQKLMANIASLKIAHARISRVCATALIVSTLCQASALAESGFTELGSDAQTSVLVSPPEGCEQNNGAFSGATSANCGTAVAGSTVSAEAAASGFAGHIGVLANVSAVGDKDLDTPASAFAEATALWHENNFHIIVSTGDPSAHDPILIDVAYGISGSTDVIANGLHGVADVGVDTGAGFTVDLNGDPFTKTCGGLTPGACELAIPAVTNDFYDGYVEVEADADASVSLDGLTGGIGQQFSVDLEYGDTVTPLGIWATTFDGTAIPADEIFVSDSGFPVLSGPPDFSPEPAAGLPEPGSTAFLALSLPLLYLLRRRYRARPIRPSAMNGTGMGVGKLYTY